MTCATRLASDRDLSLRPAEGQGLWGRSHQPRAKQEWDEAIPIYGLSQWKLDAASHVLELGCLQQNWDSYGSPPPSQRVIDKAIAIIQSIPFEDLPTPYVVPVAGGGIQFEWNISGRELEIEILPDGSAEYLKAERQSPLEEGKVAGFSNLILLLTWIQWGDRVYIAQHAGSFILRFLTRRLSNLYARLGR